MIIFCQSLTSYKKLTPKKVALPPPKVNKHLSVRRGRGPLLFLAEYLVVRRASLEPNNHKLYLAFVERPGRERGDGVDQEVVGG